MSLVSGAQIIWRWEYQTRSSPNVIVINYFLWNMYLFIYVSWLKKTNKHEFWLFALLFILLFIYTNIPTQTCWDEFLGPKDGGQDD